MNKTKEADSPIERTKQQNNKTKWLPVGSGKGEWQHRVGEKNKNVIMGLYEIMCVKLFQIVKPS